MASCHTRPLENYNLMIVNVLLFGVCLGYLYEVIG